MLAKHLYRLPAGASSLGRTSGAAVTLGAGWRGLTGKGGSSADAFANAAAAGARQPGEDKGGMKMQTAQSDLPEVGGYGEDPVAAAATAADTAKGVTQEAAQAAEGAMGAATDAASGAVGAAAEAARGVVREAASAAKGGVSAAAESVKVTTGSPPPNEDGNVAARGEAPGTSGHAMAGWTRWKKEADDAMMGGTPEPGVVLE